MKTHPLPTFKPRWTRSLAVALLSGLVPLSQSLAQPAAFSVNGEAQPVERSQVLLQGQLARGLADTPQLQAQVRETLINQALMAQEAVKAGLDKQPMVRARVDLVSQNALAQAWQQQVLQRAEISDANLQAEYQRQVQALGTQAVQLRHVLVADEKTALQLQARVKGGASFEQIATEVSLDSTTRPNGGLNDWVPEGLLFPGVAKAVQGLTSGQLAAAPVATASGWLVVRLEGRRPYTPPTLENSKLQLRRAVEQRLLQARLKTLRDAAKVE
jgi:peptidyl-prolyl cis-trans isomerase C